MTKRFSPDYLDLLAQGPFPGEIDPWAEAERYFPQLASGMLTALQDSYHAELMHNGYLVSRETSLQAFADPLHAVEISSLSDSKEVWSYAAAAAALGAEPGLPIELHDLTSLCVREVESGRLVTVLEIITPVVKEDAHYSALYRTHRRQMIAQGVNVIELDLTRSPRRLLPHPLVYSYPYHIAVHLPQENPRLLLISYGKALKPFALPLHGGAIRVDIQQCYDAAYRAARTAYHVLNDGGYTLALLPASGLLPDVERDRLEAAVHIWMHDLEALG